MYQDERELHLERLIAVASDFELICRVREIPLVITSNQFGAFETFDLDEIRQELDRLLEADFDLTNAEKKLLEEININESSGWPNSVDLLKEKFGEQRWLTYALSENGKPYSTCTEARDEAFARTWHSTLANAANWSGASSYYPTITKVRFDSNFRRLIKSETKRSKREVPATTMNAQTDSTFDPAVDDSRTFYDKKVQDWRESLTSEESLAVDLFNEHGTLAKAAKAMGITPYRYTQILKTAALKLKTETIK